MSAELLHAVEWDTTDFQRFVGLGLGRDEVIFYNIGTGSSLGSREFGFDTVDTARCFDYSASHVNLVGYGINSGSVFVTEINAAGSQKTVQLKPEATRRCNAIAFSASNVVATAYERIKQQNSLYLWDISSQGELQNVPLATVPVQETINTVKFVPDSTTQIVYGETKKIVEFDTRSHAITASMPTQLCSRIEFSKVNPNLFASYGESNFVALWDRRMIHQVPRKSLTIEPLLLIPRIFKDQKIDARSFRFSQNNENELAVLQGNSRIRRWQLSSMPAERRAPTSQLTTGLSELRSGGDVDEIRQTIMNETHDAHLISELENTQIGNRGAVGPAGSLSSSSSYAKSNSNPNSVLNSVSNKNSFGAMAQSYDEPLAKAYIDTRTTSEQPWERSLFVNKVFNVRTETDKVVSFDYTWNMLSKLPEFVCMRQSGTIYRMPISEPPTSIHFDPFNSFYSARLPCEFVVTSTDGMRICELGVKNKDPKKLEPKKVDARSGIAKLTSNVDGNPTISGNPLGCGASDACTHNRVSSGNIPITHSNEKHINSSIAEDSDNSDNEKDSTASSDGDEEEVLAGKLKPDVILNNDILTTMRMRALAGYSLDAHRNLALLTDSGIGSSSITAAWKWVMLQQNLISQPNNYLQTAEIDLRYVGVATIWDGLSKESLKTRLQRNLENGTKIVDDAVKYVVRKSPGSAYVNAGNDDTNYYRQFALRIAGWDFGLAELETKLSLLESEGKFEKAAGWAVFHNNVERAVEALAKSGKKSLRLMSTAVAGYLVYKDVSSNNVWREQCRRLASELSAPYLRAIFAYIADNSWLDVLDDGSLPLTERIGIALRFLPKKEVGKYLSTLMTRAITKGDLEGIILTGFTPKAFDLLQAYLDRSGDLQTVCLLASLAWPRFVDNPKFSKWFTEYRQLLNSWQYFSQRARLDIARNNLDPQLSTSRRAITGQAYLKCSHCKNVITWEHHYDNINSKVPKEKIKRNTGGSSVSDKKSWKLWNRCPLCNNQLPGCGVCTNSLGPCIDDEVESDRWPTFCLKCNHAFHSVHARQWFHKYDMCPVSTCKCYCSRSVSTAY